MNETPTIKLVNQGHSSGAYQVLQDGRHIGVVYKAVESTAVTTTDHGYHYVIGHHRRNVWRARRHGKVYGGDRTRAQAVARLQALDAREQAQS